MFWLALILLGIGLVASLWRRSYPQGHPKYGQHYSYPVFAVLAGFPALFLITTHLAHVGWIASTIFWLTWFITLVVVVLFAVRGGFKGAFIALFVAMGFVVLPFSSSWSSATSPSTSVTQNVGGAKALAQASPGTGTAPDSCDPAYVQQWQDNPDYRVIDGGLYEDVTHHKITPQEADKKQREVAGHDVRALAGYAYSEGLTTDPSYAHLLSPDKKCLSQQGIALLKKLFTKWDSSQVSIAQAPANATNSGMENSALVVNATSGITGDRTALKRSYVNGDSTYALARCGNPVFPGKPSKVPPGHTDQHPPTSPSPSPSTSTTTSPSPTPSHTTSTPSPTPSTSSPTPTPTTSTSTPTPTPSTSSPTPTPSCTAGQVGTPPNCLQTKDPGGNLPGPSGKPTATQSAPVETTTPTESNPANPSTKPGSGATDVPAPGSTQDTNTPTAAPTVSQAPTSGSPGTGSGNPDGNAAMGLFAPFGLLGGAWLRRKRLGG